MAKTFSNQTKKVKRTIPVKGDALDTIEGEENKHKTIEDPPPENLNSGSSSEPPAVTKTKAKADENASTRHSFIMKMLTLDKMKDFIYTKKP